MQLAPPRRRRTSPVATAALGLGALLMLVSCGTVSTVTRPDQAVVLTGADVASLIGSTPSRVVAFKLVDPLGERRWVQVPVQVDQRKVVDFGQAPTSNGVAGATGTVYGSTATSGVATLQYADASTFVGADTNPNVDADDEIAFMARDAGGRRQPGTADPSGVVAGTGVRVQVDDPRFTDRRGWVYLYRSDGSLSPGAGQDYVDYDFNLVSGSYRSTYKRADGPNPETSVVTTPTYRARMTDRWDDADWLVTTGGASGVDVLDGLKNKFALNFCGRSNITFQDAEGAFIANIDGPVRAIRSYIGANSGPLTQRTNTFYRDHQEITTNLRVHAIPGILDYLDYSQAARGMTWSSSTTAGVPIDGVADTVSATVPTWEMVSGSPGSIVTTVRVDTDIPGGDDIDAISDELYLDESPATTSQCWGDGDLLGASGPGITVGIPDTDPRNGPPATLASTRTVHYRAPGLSADAAAELAGQVDAPLVVTVSSSGP